MLADHMARQSWPRLGEGDRIMTSIGTRTLAVLIFVVSLGGFRPPTPAVANEPRQKSGEAAKKADDEKKKEEKKPLPLVPDRTIEFTTEEGTWVSLDVSPDGKTVVF